MLKLHKLTDIGRIKAAEAKIAEVLRLHPGIQERTAAFFSEEPNQEQIEGFILSDENENKIHTLGIRLDQATLDRADSLQDFVASRPELRAMGRVSRAAVLRLAILKGLDVIESDKIKAEAKAEAKR